MNIHQLNKYLETGFFICVGVVLSPIVLIGFLYLKLFKKGKENLSDLGLIDLESMREAWNSYPTQDNEGYVPDRGGFKSGWFAALRWERSKK